MATYYIDFEGGNDANAGTSFATRWKTITNGATFARIGPGDEIRIMASPDPTSIGNATWTGGGRPVAVNIQSSTNATPIVITTSTAHGLVPGDYVVVTNHTGNTNANGVWKVGTTPTSTTFQILQIDGSNTTGNGAGGASGNISNVSNCIVRTASPLVQNIALCGGLGQKPVWTASTNVTTSSAAASKEGNGAAQIAVGATFTTGKAAYYTLPATLDLSGYQQVSFWVQLNSGTLGAAGQTYVALCSDTLGNTVVHQCPIPSLGNSAAWVPITVNLGANLSSTINSVAFYVVTDVGAQTFILDDIIACKAASASDSITLQSLISKSDGTGTESWYAIESINYDAIMLASINGFSSLSTNIRGYYGATETVTTYKRETIKTAISAASGNVVSSINDSGTAGSPITYSGGWNRTDMSTQTGRTWLDGLNGLGVGITPSTTVAGSYITLDKIDLCRYSTGVSFTSSLGNTDLTISSCYATACGTGVTINSAPNTNFVFGSLWVSNNSTGLSASGWGHSFSQIYSSNCNTGSGFSTGSYDIYIGSIDANNTITSGLTLANTLDCVFNSVSVNKNVNTAINISGGSVYINGGILADNVSGVTCANSGRGYFNNLVINDTLEVLSGSSGAAYAIYSNRHDNTDGNNWVFQPVGTINQQTAIVDSPATTAWLMRPTSANATANAPLKLKLGTVVCAANSLVTVTARMRRSNTGLTMRLTCPGGQISGVSSDVTSDMTAAANTWETVTITFTPTKPGGVDIYAYAFGGTTYSGYVCNLTASQA